MTDLIERLQAALPERYTVEREIGRGGMSTVYLARELHPSRRVAIKVLHPELTVRIGRERFLREVDFVSNLTHPHIVPIYAAGEAGGLLYFVMPFVDGETLGDLLEKAKALSPGTALRIGAHIARALEYAHRRNIVHRDIKPENILLHDNFALVTDFGVARAIRVAGEESVTLSGMTVGTPAYMSPEQASGASVIDARADIYGLGCMLFEMLTGRPPFGKGPGDQVLARQITEKPPSARSVAHGIPPDVDVMLQKALAKDPDKRFASAGEFAEVQEQLRSQFASGSRRLGLGGTGPRGRSGRALMAAAVVVIALIAAFALRSRASAFPLLALPQSYADSIAVMPVENLTSNRELDRLADAITYGAINAMLDVTELKIASYFSVRRLGALQLTARQVSDSLSVRLIVAAQFREMGDRISLDVELSDGTRDVVLDSRSWRIDPSAGTALEPGLVRRLVEVMTEGTGLDAHPVRTAELHGPAYEAYRLGLHWWGRRTPEGIRRSLEYFLSAIAVDSSYAPAYEGLSSSYMLALFYRYEIGIPGYETARRALAAANRAVALDPLYARGYAARGYVTSRAYGPTRSSSADYERALELSPNAAQVASWSGAILGQQGKPAEALAATERGVELNPLSPATHLALAYGALRAGMFDLAVRAARKSTELEPQLAESRGLEGRALLLGGRAVECLEVAFGPHEAIRAACMHAAGFRDEAQAIIDSISGAVRSGQLHDTVHTDVLRADGLASYYAWVGDAERAFEWVAYGFERSPMGIERRVLESAMFDRLRSGRGRAQRLAAITERAWERVRQGADVAR